MVMPPTRLSGLAPDVHAQLPTLAVGLRCWHAKYHCEIEIVEGKPDSEGDYRVRNLEGDRYFIPYSWLQTLDKQPLITITR